MEDAMFSAKDREEQQDYLGQDGLLYCGKCHFPKQKRLAWGPEGSPPTLVPVACQCQQQQQEQQALRSSQLQFRMDMDRRKEDGICCPDGLRYRFDQDDLAQPKVSQVCRRYVENWQQMRRDNIGILFYGSVGSGKSFLASCIGNGLLERQVPVAAASFPRLLNLLQGTYAKQALLDRLAVYQLLILDDLGAERASSYAEEQVFNIVDARLSSRLPVIVTTNLTMEQLEHPASLQCARIYDRVLELCPIRLKLTGPSRRAQNAQQREALAKQLLLPPQPEQALEEGAGER